MSILPQNPKQWRCNLVYKQNPFISFLEALRTPNNQSILNTIMEGYQVLLEFPHAVLGNNSLADLHIEDMIQKEGKEKTIAYINQTLHNIKANKPINIPYNRGNELKTIERPLDDLDKRDIDIWVNSLNKIKNSFTALSLTEARKHFPKRFAEEESPIKEDDVLTVYHGFNDILDAVTTAKFGLSGKTKARRLYSYESGNNPKGLFVSIDMNAIKKGGFAHSGVIMEFATKVKDLEAPVWAGGGSYFVQGQYTQSFKDDDDRKEQILQNRKEAEKSDIPSISKSDKPELAQTLFQNAERQALYIGDLNSNMIRAFWVNEKLMNDRRHGGEWVRISPKQFVKKYVTEENTQETTQTFKGLEKKTAQRYREAEDKIFKPNDDFDEQKVVEFIKEHQIEKDEFINDLKMSKYHRHAFMWPKQIKQFEEKY